MDGRISALLNGWADSGLQMSIIYQCSASTNILAPKIMALNISSSHPLKKQFRSSRKRLYRFSAIYVNHLPKHNCRGGIFREIMVPGGLEGEL
jgi:hypothetical protein